MLAASTKLHKPEESKQVVPPCHLQ